MSTEISRPNEVAHSEQQRIQKLLQDLITQQRGQVHQQQVHLESLRQIEASFTTFFEKRCISPDKQGPNDAVPTDGAKLELQRVAGFEHVPAHSSGHINRSIIEKGQAGGGVKSELSVLPGGESLRKSLSSAKLSEKSKKMKRRLIGFKWAKAIVEHDAFTSAITFLIFLNAIFITFESDEYMQRVVDTWRRTPANEKLPQEVPGGPGWMFPVSMIFGIVFTVELFLRILGEGVAFVFGANRMWNALDSTCLLSVYLDLILASLEVTGYSFISFLRILRIAKALRSFRVIRAMRFLNDLNVMLKTIYKGFSCLCSALGAVFGVIYILDLVLLQLLAEEILNSKGGNKDVIVAIDNFGSFFSTLLTLWTAVFDEWRFYYDVLAANSTDLAILFMVGTLMIVVGPLNIITGIFVEQAAENLRSDWEFAKQSQREKQKRSIAMFIELFQDLDADGSGCLQWEEWAGYLETEEANHAFGVFELDIDKFRSNEFFKMADADGTGEISLQEFVLACMAGVGSNHPVDEVMLNRNRLDLSRDIDEAMKKYSSKMQVLLDSSLTSFRGDIDTSLEQFRRGIECSLSELPALARQPPNRELFI